MRNSALHKAIIYLYFSEGYTITEIHRELKKITKQAIHKVVKKRLTELK